VPEDLIDVHFFFAFPAGSDLLVETMAIEAILCF
jgi:hypothetical protein